MSVDTARSQLPISFAISGLMMCLTFVWGVNSSVTKLAGLGFSPLAQIIGRSAISIVCIYAWCIYRHVPLFSRDGTLWPGVAAGALFGLEFVFLFFGIDMTSAARAALFVNTMPFFLMLGSYLLFGQRFSGMKFAGLTVAFVGVALAFLDKLSLPSPDAIFGDFLCLLAGLSWAATIMVLRRTSLAKAPAEKTLLYQLLGALFLALPMLPFGGNVFREVTMVPMLALLFQALFVVAITYLIWFWLIKHYDTTGLSSFTFLSPVFGVLAGGLFLGEPISGQLLLGLALVVTGLIIVNRPARPNSHSIPENQANA